MSEPTSNIEALEQFLRYPHLDDAAHKILGSYDRFLGMLGDEEQRRHLEVLSEAEAEMDSIFQSARRLTHDYRDGLLTVFFDAPSGIDVLTRNYGVF
jgi:hypothetical protein